MSEEFRPLGEKGTKHILQMMKNQEVKIDELEEAIDNIQSTSKSTLSKSGWYRIAEYKARNDDTFSIKGASANSCEVTIKRGFSYNSPEIHKLLVLPKYNDIKIHSLYSQAHDFLIPRVRYTVNDSNNIAYIELYYSIDSANDVIVLLNSQQSVWEYSWKAITPTLTEETVDGVTVSCEYDIHADAKPVTDLDIGYLEKRKMWNDSWTSVETPPIGIYQIASSQVPIITDLPSGIPANVVVWLIKLKSTDENTFIVHVPKTNKVYFGSRYGEKLTWNTGATTADLANYLQLNNGSSIPRVTVYGATGIILKNISTYNNTHAIQFEDVNGVLGLLGFKNRELMVQKFTDNVAGEWRFLLHTGNKPSGSYIGNGDATARQIITGGIGKVVIIYGTNDSMAILTGTSGVCVDSTSVRRISGGNAGIIDGTIISMATTDNALNASGVTYYYNVV